MSKITPILLADLKNLLSTPEAIEAFTKIQSEGRVKASDLDALVGNLDMATTPEAITDAWGEIATVLAETYMVSQGDLKRNGVLLQGLDKSLINVANSCLDDVTQQVAANVDLKSNTALLAKIFELPFAVCKFNSVNDRVAEYLDWYARTRSFVETYLPESLADAKLSGGYGSEISRRLTQQTPIGTLADSITYLLRSITLYKKNGVALGGADASLRHEQNSLCVAMSKEILELLEKASAIDVALLGTLNQKADLVIELLQEIEPHFLNAGVNLEKLRAEGYANLSSDQVTDPKRLSTMLATLGLVKILTNNIYDDVASIFAKSLEFMPRKDIAQFSNIMNRDANFLLAYAAKIYGYAAYKHNNLIARANLETISGHSYVKLANKFFAYDVGQDPELSSFADQDIAVADQLVAKAVQLYVDSFNSTQGNAGEKYGKEAEKFLLKICNHPACQSNSAAMEIVANALKAKEEMALAQSALTPSFAKAQAKATNVFALQAKSAPTSKVVFITGGLAGSGKTTHLQKLIDQLQSQHGRFVKYLDKDVIGSQMPAGTTSPQIYAEMVARAEKDLATNDVIVMEGNTIGNLSCFTDFIEEQNAEGVTVIALYFRCSDAQQQFDRLFARAQVDAAAAERDKNKLQSFDYYRDTDRPGEIKRHDDQLAKNKGLIEDKVLHLMTIETATPTMEPNAIASAVDSNVQLIVKFMEEKMAADHSVANQARRAFSALPSFGI